MKKNWMLFLFFAASAALTFSGCSDDDNSDVPENLSLIHICLVILVVSDE